MCSESYMPTCSVSILEVKFGKIAVSSKLTAEPKPPRWLLHAQGPPRTEWRHDGATDGAIADAEAPQHGLADSGEPVLAPPAAAQSSLSLIRDFPQEHRGFS